MVSPLPISNSYSAKRINDLFTVYIQQVNRVYPLPGYVKKQLSSQVFSNTAPVWIVDDDPDDQLFIKAAFNSIRPDIQITTLDDGETLLSRIAQTRAFPKMVILDLNMPRITGFDALERLRGNPTYDRVTIVVLTASSVARINDRKQAMALGANQFYTKPCTYKDLIALIKTMTVDLCD